MAHEIYQDCIGACFVCAQECEHCGDACIGMTEMAIAFGRAATARNSAGSAQAI